MSEEIKEVKPDEIKPPGEGEVDKLSELTIKHEAAIAELNTKHEAANVELKTSHVEALEVSNKALKAAQAEAADLRAAIVASKPKEVQYKSKLEMTDKEFEEHQRYNKQFKK